MLSEVPGEPVSGEGEGGDGPGRDIENDEGTAHVEDDEGDIPGKHVERRSKGIRIIPTEEFPNEKEQAWVALEKGAVVINILHPFYITMKESDRFGKFEKFNIHRVLIEALIKFKNDELKDLVLNENDNYDEIIFGENFGRISDIKFSPDGSLYVATHVNNGAIFKLTLSS